MNLISIILWITGFLSFIAGLASIISWIEIRHTYRKNEFTFRSPRVGVIVPCKGRDRKFIGNIKAMCNQYYENYRIVFVVDSENDPSYKTVEKIIKKYKHVELVISKPRENCSGKISALLHGIETIGDVDIYIFADSDIRPHKNWIKYLIAPLEDKTIGATTGYRWYFPHNLWTLILSSWNACTATTLFLGKYNFTWGGSTAIRKQLFDELNVKEKWERSLSDDLVLTTILRENGYKIRFVPQAIVECFEDKNLYELIKWGTRQNVWTKWYYPSLWRKSVIGAITFKTFNIIGVILIITGNIIQGLLLFSPVILDLIKGWQQFLTFRELMLYPKNRFGSALAFMIVSPITPFLITTNLFLSIFKREIEWRGKKYSIKKQLEIETYQKTISKKRKENKTHSI